MNKKYVISVIGVVSLLWLAGCKCQIETGKTADTSRKSEGISGELEISNIVFCSEEPSGYMEYQEQPEATYKPGDVVWIYCNLEGVKYNVNPDSSQETWITVNLKVISPDDEVVLEQEILNEHRNFPKEFDMNTLFLKININTTPEMEEGRYIAKVTLNDKLAGREVTASSVFNLKK